MLSSSLFSSLLISSFYLRSGIWTHSIPVTPSCRCTILSLLWLLQKWPLYGLSACVVCWIIYFGHGRRTIFRGVKLDWRQWTPRAVCNSAGIQPPGPATANTVQETNSWARFRRCHTVLASAREGHHPVSLLFNNLSDVDRLSRPPFPGTGVWHWRESLSVMAV